MPDEAIKKRLSKPNPEQNDQGWKFFVCPVCQKEFSLFGKSGWAYKKKLHGYNKPFTFFCNYTCMRKAEQIKNGISES